MDELFRELKQTSVRALLKKFWWLRKHSLRNAISQSKGTSLSSIPTSLPSTMKWLACSSSKQPSPKTWNHFDDMLAFCPTLVRLRRPRHSSPSALVILKSFRSVLLNWLLLMLLINANIMFAKRLLSHCFSLLPVGSCCSLFPLLIDAYSLIYASRPWFRSSSLLAPFVQPVRCYPLLVDVN